MENSNVIRAPICFTESDYSHCAKCIAIVEYLLSPNTDGESFEVSPDDVEFLARLLYLVHNIMGEVIEASEGSDNDI